MAVVISSIATRVSIEECLEMEGGKVEVHIPGQTMSLMVWDRSTCDWIEGHFKNDKIDGVGNVIINNYIQANKNEVFIPIMLLQGMDVSWEGDNP